MTDLGIITRPITHGSNPDLYLRSRGIVLRRFPNDLRMDENQNMVAIIRDKSGEAVSYQRTFLTREDDGSFTKTRMMKKGAKIPEGSAIRLHEAGRVMGVAESTENALTGSRLFQVPSYALLSAGQMERWLPPAGVKRLLIFADDDRNMVGELAARNLANEAAARGVSVSVHLPRLNHENHLNPRFGDWNNFLMERRKCDTTNTGDQSKDGSKVRLERSGRGGLTL